LPLPEGWDEEKLEAALFAGQPQRASDPEKATPDFGLATLFETTG
jgi:hypothetical protein